MGRRERGVKEVTFRAFLRASLDPASWRELWRRIAWSKREHLNGLIWMMFLCVAGPSLLLFVLTDMGFTQFVAQISLAFNVAIGMKAKYPDPCERCGHEC